MDRRDLSLVSSISKVDERSYREVTVRGWGFRLRRDRVTAIPETEGTR